VSAREIAVKKYVVTLSTEERERLQTLIRSGKHSARKLMRARILLKADASQAGDAWSDRQIADGLDTSLVTVARIRQQLVEEGVDGVLTPKRSPNSASPTSRIRPRKTRYWSGSGSISIWYSMTLASG